MHKSATEKNFIPPAIVDGPTDKHDCSAFALSFFSSEEQARKRYASLAERMDVSSRLGDQIGKIELSCDDGLISNPNTNGHMDLHPFEGIVFVGRIIEYLPTSVLQLVGEGRD